MTQAQLRNSLYTFATYATAICDSDALAKGFDKLKPILDDTFKAEERLEELTDKQVHLEAQVDGALGRLSTEVSKLVENQGKFAQELEAVGEVRKSMEETLRKTQEMVDTLPKAVEQGRAAFGAANGPTVVEVGGQPSYAAVVHHQLPISHVLTLTRQANHARQVMIDVKKWKSREEINLTEEVLVAKANQTLELIADDTVGQPADASFLSVRKQHHGGLLY